MIKKAFFKWQKFSASWTGTIIIVLTIIFFVAQAFVIPSGSMKNSMLIGDMLFVKKFSYGIPTPRIPWLELAVLPDFNDNGHLIEGDRPKRGDIVIFRYPNNDKIHYVKRCVAVGGDILFLRDKNLYLHPKEGNKYVEDNYSDYDIIKLNNMSFIKTPYRKQHIGIHHDKSVSANDLNQPLPLFNMLPIKIPKDEFFMMGDNRDHSNDSRFWGTVPYKNIVGKPWFIYFSWDENKEIRWERIFKSVDYLEENGIISNEILNHQKGIY